MFDFNSPFDDFAACPMPQHYYWPDATYNQFTVPEPPEPLDLAYGLAVAEFEHCAPPTTEYNEFPEGGSERLAQALAIALRQSLTR